MFMENHSSQVQSHYKDLQGNLTINSPNTKWQIAQSLIQTVLKPVENLDISSVGIVPVIQDEFTIVIN